MKIRASYLTGYADCSRRTFLDMFYSEAEEFGYEFRRPVHHVGAAIGTASHRGIATDLQGIKDGKLITRSDAEAIGIEKYRALSAERIGYDSTSQNANVAEKHIRRILAKYYHDIHPGAKPLHVEKEFKVKYKGFLIVGHPDLIETDFKVVDFKTGARKTPYQAQLGMYAKILEIISKEKCGGLTVAHIPRKKDMTNPVLKNYIYNVEASINHAISLVDSIINHYNTFIETEEPSHILANPMSYLCSRKWCKAYGTDFCELTKE